jgi:hypothetical protein
MFHGNYLDAFLKIFSVMIMLIRGNIFQFYSWSTIIIYAKIKEIHNNYITQQHKRCKKSF